jgi:hypothetical protein
MNQTINPLPIEFWLWLGVTIFLCAFQSPLSMYIGFCFGSRQRKKGVIGLILQVILTMFDTWIFWRMFVLAG